jgi:uncharacterized 2Fe-2S/4Fe-4S cluster protein (DUF4445 family)
MPVVEFYPSKKQTIVPSGTLLIEAARLAGIEVETPCGGNGSCGKCIVKVLGGKVDPLSYGQLPREVVADGQVLACKARVLESDVAVEVAETWGYKGGKFSDYDATCLIRAELLPRDWDFDPLAVKWRLEVPPPQQGDGLGDIDRIARMLQKDWGKQEVIFSLTALRQTARALREKDGLVTVTFIREPHRFRIIHVEAGDSTPGHYAIAVDVGTTTIAVQLISLTQGKILGTMSDYNDQIPCGLDVISRINFAGGPGGLAELRQRVLDTINRLISQLAEVNEIHPDTISNAVVSGNTVMTHLLLGLEPEYIRLDPYTPTVMEVPYVTAAEVGLKINPDSWVYFSPCVGSYVGGDITAGLLCTDLATSSEEVNLFIDIGTNGEIVVGNSDFLMACACSAGPAFEGGGIECGMRAALGAIEKVEIDPSTAQASYVTIGGVPPRGICGSGMIDLLANLYLTGWIGPNGQLDRTRPSPFITLEGRRAFYTIVPAEESASSKPLVITETDIDNILRAKAAIYSACEMLIHQAGMSFEDLKHIYIAGGFGRFLDLEKATLIGLVPDLPGERFQYIGNSSLVGSYMAVVSREYRQRQLQVSSRITYVELNSDPSYMDHYTASLFLPHTNLDLFPSVQARKGRLALPQDA